MQETKYSADLYLRLSKQDGDNEESDSIGNQRALIQDFLKSMPDIAIHKIRIDDGYSGVDFNRPSFIEMIDDIRKGEVNCVVVKDFSRFGRNYIESGKYIQQLFSRTGIRFIAINDSYDSARAQSYSDSIIVPFKNLLNDNYSADVSVKVRTHLEVKRKNGEFVGAFAVYGYAKCPENKSKLVIDSFAADVVRDIYRLKIEGMSADSIADKLNQSGILSPMEYKHYNGQRYCCEFKINISAKWTATAVFRILQNAVYTGVLEQGKRMKPNYKVRKLVNVPKEQWQRREGAHDAIIEKSMFDTVQILMTQDTRAVKKGGTAFPLSGVIFCADCGTSMVRKTNSRGGVRYPYYVCSKHRSDIKVCSTHIISASDCENAVLDALLLHTSTVLDIEKAMNCAENMAYRQDSVRKLTARLEVKQDEIKRYNDYRLSLYENYREGIIPKEDFISFKNSYDNKISKAETVVQTLKEEIEIAAAGEVENHDWIGKFRGCLNAETIDRRMVAELIERVDVYEKGRIKVTFRYFNEFERLSDAVKGAA